MSKKIIRTPEEWHEKYLETLEKYRPIDDDFFVKLVRDNPELAEEIIRIILKIDDIHITSLKVQDYVTKLAGMRGVRFDALCTDSTGKIYDVEMQRRDDGARPKRARYYSSSIDADYLHSGEDFELLPTTYVIFITENDYYGQNRLIYHFDRMDKDSGIVFEDEAHIIYVNGAYENPDDKSALAQLVSDFRCNNAKDMQNKVLADRTRFFKETPEGVSDVCKYIEDIQKAAKEEAKLITLIDLVKKGLLTIIQAAQEAEMTVPEFTELMDKSA